MKRLPIITLTLGAALVAAAYDIVWLNADSGLSMGVQPEADVDIVYSSDYSEVKVMQGTTVLGTVATSALQNVTFGDTDGECVLDFSGSAPRFYCPECFADATMQGMTVAADGDHVTITLGDSFADMESFAFTVTGTTTDGQVKVYGDIPVYVTLSDASITNQSGSAVNLQVSAKCQLILSGSNYVEDGAEYSTPDGEKEKSTVYSLKALTIKGDGSLQAKGNYKHAICSEKSITLESGTVEVVYSANDGIHASGVTIDGGCYVSQLTTGDGIDADDSSLLINGGTVDINISADDVKALKADGLIQMEGGDITLTISSPQGKGLKSKEGIVINGGAITANTSGAAVVTDGDPSYCTVIKSDDYVTINGGTVKIKSTGSGSKGISADGDITIYSGDFQIEQSGAGVVYTDANNNYDTYCCTAITGDANIYLYGGTFDISNTGSAGKGIKADVEIVIGNADGGPTINAKTTGARISESQAGGWHAAAGPGGGGGNNPGGGGGGWGPGGGDFNQNEDYANPKVIKAIGNLIVNNGALTLSSSQDGGEGLESKSTLTINGGDIYISTYDDCINAANHIEIAGGVIRCLASGNDAIDSNGTLTISGGVVIAVGTSSPEGGLDCDNNRFAITGGIIVGLGGDNSTPTTSACTQRVVLYGTTSFSNGTTYTITNPSGEQVFSFKSPKSVSGQMLFSSPGITNNGTYTIYTGGTVTGGTEYYDITVDAEYTPGSAKKTFTPTQMVTTVR